MAEFDLIARLAAHARARADVALGIGDDAAVLDVPEGEQLVACCDTLNEGVHFLPGTDPADIGWKSLAVNLSDLAAMGARPAWALLSLSLPRADAGFVDGFMRGFSALADSAGVALVGGDTTSGSLSICVTALGFLPRGQALARSGAQVGDVVCVSGTLGDAAAALARIHAGAPMHGDAARALCQRMRRPIPRLALGLALRGVAHAVIDVSDGVLADLAHVARASGVAIELEAEALPASDALRELCDPATRLRHQATGGDDYELAFTLPIDQIDAVRTLFANYPLTPTLSPASGGEGAELVAMHAAPSPSPPSRAMGERVGVRGTLATVTRIGRVVAGEGVRLLDANGKTVKFARGGWEHFTQGAR